MLFGAVDGAVDEVDAFPLVGEGVELDAGAGDAVNKTVVFVIYVAVEVVYAHDIGIVALGIDLHPFLGLEVNVAEVAGP